jgi:hypothetical protein
VRNEPHLVWVSRNELDGTNDLVVVHLVCAVTERDEQCTVDLEHQTLGAALVDGWEPGLYWLRAWPHVHVSFDVQEHSVEYEAVPIRNVPDWVIENLP